MQDVLCPLYRPEVLYKWMLVAVGGVVALTLVVET